MSQTIKSELKKKNVKNEDESSHCDRKKRREKKRICKGLMKYMTIS